MSAAVFFAVLLAALLHACWNSLVKSGGDKTAAMLAVALGHVPIALAFLPFVALPGLDTWAWILASVLVHLGYQLALISSYRLGDLTLVYPIARGSAPALVTLVSVFFLGQTFTGFQYGGISLVVASLILLGLISVSKHRAGLRPLVMALITGGFIAGYSLIDGTGARLSGSAMGYWAISAIGTALALALWCAVWRPSAFTAFKTTPNLKWVALGGGTASYAAYALVIWGFTHVPIPLVTALRETSILFALLIGFWIMGERFTALKGLAVVMILAGAICLRL